MLLSDWDEFDGNIDKPGVRCCMEELSVGAFMNFGAYQWRVLDVKENAALIITENIIEQGVYHDAYVDITWADCSLRRYLNGEFYQRFTAEEKARIVPVINKNPDNPWYGSAGGADTQDRIFLLNLDEVACKYFGDSSELLYQPKKNQRYWFERKDENNEKRKARLEENQSICWWWIRTPGRVSVKAVYIHGDGNIGIQGNNIFKGNIADGRCTGGIRPALWLNLQ
jgi:Family of unknown function (DUF6273)